MKPIKKITEALGLLSPVFILLFSCAAYIVRPADDSSKKEQSIESTKSERVDVMQDVLMQKF